MADRVRDDHDRRVRISFWVRADILEVGHGRYVPIAEISPTKLFGYGLPRNNRGRALCWADVLTHRCNRSHALGSDGDRDLSPTGLQFTALRAADRRSIRCAILVQLT